MSFLHSSTIVCDAGTSKLVVTANRSEFMIFAFFCVFGTGMTTKGERDMFLNIIQRYANRIEMELKTSLAKASIKIL